MTRIKCKISYDGTNYAGYQIQPNGRTIQEEIESALKKIHKGDEVRITASGRTDAGVHAIGQVFHFDTPLAIPEQNWKRALNALLPDDIYVKEASVAGNDFHARFDVQEKEYRYFVLNSSEKDIFRRNYTYYYPREIDINAVLEACKQLEGEHDFSSFCAAKTGVKGEKVRTIFHASCFKEGDNLVFVFRGSGFLYNMVRILVGTLIEIGTGMRKPDDIKKIIEAMDRGKAGKTAPSQGLYLWNVVYNK
ncbi:tRNA pseudouridine(38-40) synthase TruA [Aquibacillus koreensis]|uniref:tRNA pseudouridine synthase A n=1 Tax=Aquibacillus koreensis TaxID=279446 RepID=A0A9X4ALH6_9BACI|nr:tRNA pseudouridine(38-40) synthase TruA [Aquibacillus koreensis]MCT2536569.1 tRNA pseudouridine(38-40) synthase TruA [Aquibacillus koreensis]MDC3422483.1 tRNA pseudouridine(38-40) synthase TruA [Aquibacillus koreensis]